MASVDGTNDNLCENRCFEATLSPVAGIELVMNPEMTDVRNVPGPSEEVICSDAKFIWSPIEQPSGAQRYFLPPNAVLVGLQFPIEAQLTDAGNVPPSVCTGPTPVVSTAIPSNSPDLEVAAQVYSLPAPLYPTLTPLYPSSAPLYHSVHTLSHYPVPQLVDPKILKNNNISSETRLVFPDGLFPNIVQSSGEGFPVNQFHYDGSTNPVSSSVHVPPAYCPSSVLLNPLQPLPPYGVSFCPANVPSPIHVCIDSQMSMVSQQCPRIQPDLNSQMPAALLLSELPPHPAYFSSLSPQTHFVFAPTVVPHGFPSDLFMPCASSVSPNLNEIDEGCLTCWHNCSIAAPSDQAGCLREQRALNVSYHSPTPDPFNALMMSHYSPPCSSSDVFPNPHNDAISSSKHATTSQSPPVSILGGFNQSPLCQILKLPHGNHLNGFPVSAIRIVPHLPPQSPAVMSCANCGGGGHQYLDCTETIAEPFQGKIT